MFTLDRSIVKCHRTVQYKPLYFRIFTFENNNNNSFEEENKTDAFPKTRPQIGNPKFIRFKRGG